MSKNKKYHQLYDRLLEEVEMLHERIKVGIRQGLKMLVIVPLLFMLIMFLTQGSKGIFLVLWIVSTFVIAAFLIALEYVDHGIQKRLEEITGMENALPEDSIMPEIEIPEIDIEELRLIAQERRSQLPLHKLKEKLAAEDAHTEAEEASEAEPPKDAEPIVEAPVIAAAAEEEKAADAEETETASEAPFVIEKNAEAEDNDAPFIFEESAKMKPEDEDAETPFTFDESAKAESGSSKSEKEDAEDVVKV